MNTRLSNTLLGSARRLRRRSTNAERLLWHLLRRKDLHGLKFRRQEPIDPFIVDFACIESRVVVELDGEYHDEEEQKKKDAERTQHLNSLGFEVIRFSNDFVFEHTDEMLDAIENICMARSPLRVPPPKGEGTLLGRNLL